MSKLGLKTKKNCGNETSISGNMTIHFRQGSVETHIRRGGQYISHIVGNLFKCHSSKIIEIGCHST